MGEDLRKVEYKWYNGETQKYDFDIGFHHGFYQFRDEDWQGAVSIVENEITGEVVQVSADNIRFIS